MEAKFDTIPPFSVNCDSVASSIIYGLEEENHLFLRGQQKRVITEFIAKEIYSALNYKSIKNQKEEP